MTNAPTPITPVRAGSLPRRTTAPANWAKWKLIPQCTLWDAACLTLDIEPNPAGIHDWLTRKRPPDGFPAEFSDRLAVLTANFDADVFRVVQIADVAAAAIGWGWAIPEAMKSLPTAPVLVGAVESAPTRESTDDRNLRWLNRYETEEHTKKCGAYNRTAAHFGVESSTLRKAVNKARQERTARNRDGIKAVHKKGTASIFDSLGTTVKDGKRTTNNQR
jgi:hypothetical protein